MVGFEKALRAVKVIKDQIQYRSQSLLNLARGYFSQNNENFVKISLSVSNGVVEFHQVKNAWHANVTL